MFPINECTLLPCLNMLLIKVELAHSGSLDQLLSTDVLNMILFSHETFIAEVAHIVEIIRSSSTADKNSSTSASFLFQAQVITISAPFWFIRRPFFHAICTFILNKSTRSKYAWQVAMCRYLRGLRSESSKDFDDLTGDGRVFVWRTRMFLQGKEWWDIENPLFRLFAKWSLHSSPYFFPL